MTVTTATDASATTAAGKSEGSIGKLNADFDLFLKLLVAQMQNQDPMDPMDTSQFTQQLVQYSQVEQSMEQTETLKAILAGMETQDLVQASALIGRRIEVGSAEAGLGSEPIEWSWSSNREIASLTATIRDAKGRAVDTRTLDASANGSFSWNGSLSNGDQAAPGLYTLELKALDAAGAAVSPAIRSSGTVREVRSGEDGVTLGVNGRSVPADQVLRIAEG